MEKIGDRSQMVVLNNELGTKIPRVCCSIAVQKANTWRPKQPLNGPVRSALTPPKKRRPHLARTKMAYSLLNRCLFCFRLLPRVPGDSRILNGRGKGVPGHDAQALRQAGEDHLWKPVGASAGRRRSL